MLRRTPLYEEHLILEAKMVPFAGWEMPLSYKGIIAEHEAVRTNCGIFDIGHMGIVDLSGKDALAFIDYAATNDASLLSENECQYSILCNSGGGVIDDILVYRLSDRFRLVVNAVNTNIVLNHLKEESKSFKELELLPRDDLSLLSLQGPKAEKMVDAHDFARKLEHNHSGEWRGIPASRTGYTGEDGFEFFTSKELTVKIWRQFIANEVAPCGLGARDTLRIEAGLPLYGHEYDLKTNPIEAGYSWAVKLNKPAFIGRDSLLKIKEIGPARKLVGLKLQGKMIPRQGFKVKDGERRIGVITSGTFSPTLKIPIALAYLDKEYAVPDKPVFVQIREADCPAVVSPKKIL